MCIPTVIVFGYVVVVAIALECVIVVVCVLVSATCCIMWGRLGLCHAGVYRVVLCYSMGRCVVLCQGVSYV